MNIEYQNDLVGVDWQRVSALFKLVGWGARNPSEIRAAFEKSSYVRFAYADDVIVGFGRTVDDGKYYALIVDLAIDPQYQGQGIGSNILLYLQESLEKYAFTTLTSAVGKEQFYLKQGWQVQKTSFIWPRSEKQRDDHSIVNDS
jgi:aralkylamine N-acetyltransferase